MATMIDAPPDGALAAAKAYLRIDTDAEDALLALLLQTAVGLCERFTGLALFVGDRHDVIVPKPEGWARLPATPVSAITGVEAVDAGGVATPLAVDAYAIDIDEHGDGYVRGPGRAAVSYRAGLAADWASLPAPLAQGIVRLAAHLHAHRDEADDAGPPAAVAALWRPWRRMRLS